MHLVFIIFSLFFILFSFRQACLPLFGGSEGNSNHAHAKAFFTASLLYACANRTYGARGVNSVTSAQYQNMARYASHILVLVDLRGIEPLSENLLIQLSPGAGCLLCLFPLNAGIQALSESNRFLHDRLNGKTPMHVHHSNDAQSRFVVLPRGTGGHSETAALPTIEPRRVNNQAAKATELLSFIFLSLSSLRDYSALPAYHTSKSPSKPLQTHRRRHGRREYVCP